MHEVFSQPLSKEGSCLGQGRFGRLSTFIFSRCFKYLLLTKKHAWSSGFESTSLLICRSMVGMNKYDLLADLLATGTSLWSRALHANVPSWGLGWRPDTNYKLLSNVRWRTVFLVLSLTAVFQQADQNNTRNLELSLTTKKDHCLPILKVLPDQRAALRRKQLCSRFWGAATHMIIYLPSHSTIIYHLCTVYQDPFQGQSRATNNGGSFNICSHPCFLPFL